jgi:energy-coupling factor transporter ATP-binding protein EcfA2
MSLIVKKITVEKLFGKFNYDLNLDNGYDVSILIAPNGCGKTTILNFLSFILDPSAEAFAKICDIPFIRYSCVLSNNTCLELYKGNLDDARIFFSVGKYKVFIDNETISKFISVWNGFKSTYPKIIESGHTSTIGWEVENGTSLFALCMEYDKALLNDDAKDYICTDSKATLSSLALQLFEDIKKNSREAEKLRAKLTIKEIEAKKLYDQYIRAKDMLDSDTEYDAQKQSYANDAINYQSKYVEASAISDNSRKKLFDLECYIANMQKRLNGILNKCSPSTRKKILEREDKKLEKPSAEKFFIAFYKATSKVKINFIRADRLLTINNNGYSEDAVTIVNRDIKNRFNAISEEYNKNLSVATDNIVVQFVNSNDNYQKLNRTNPDYNKIKKNWDKYVKEVTLLSMSNLIDSKSRFICLFDNIEPDDEKMVSFMRLCTEEFNKTLEPFRDFYKQLDRFTRILNERNEITEKVLSFSKDDGFTLKTWDGRSLQLERMSSGEKNDFVMFYNLIFNSKDGDLVLIDEPEISLHIRWQKSFMSTMLDICRMNKLQVFVATHSPHIINGYLDLLVEGGPANEQ